MKFKVLIFNAVMVLSSLVYCVYAKTTEPTELQGSNRHTEKATIPNSWPLWQHFQSEFISGSGRVIDPYDGLSITTSEGQSYAMFFALVNNQPELFDALLSWTEKHLANGDLANNLPSWQWGQKRSGANGVLDQNSASDSDLWILYNLFEAARLWNKPEYQRLAEQFANTILQSHVYFVDEIGHFLLPAANGFVQKNKSIKLNPSYVPMQLMDYFSAYLIDPRWESLRQTSVLVTMESAPRGFAPDWIDYNLNSGTFTSPSAGSYNAIRVYLWAGMLSNQSQYWSMFKTRFAKAVQFVSKLKGVPESINTDLLAYNNLGNIGFDISFLPLISRLQYPELEQAFVNKIKQSDILTSKSYYQSVLALYGLGWREKRFEFSKNGQLIVSWHNEK